MRTRIFLFRALFIILVLWLPSIRVLGADPGLPYPAGVEWGDQRTGSVLIYNLYTSSADGSRSTETILTNTHSTQPVRVHFFMVDGNTGLPTDLTLCLTPNQTLHFSASDMDPGIIGYMIGVAVDNAGCPISFNYLSGSAIVRPGMGGVEASLGAQAVSALFSGVMPGCGTSSMTADLVFDGGNSGYSRLPRMLATDKVRSLTDNNQTMLILNRIDGSLVSGMGPLGVIAGELFDESAVLYSFTAGSNSCQLRNVTSQFFPNTSPPFPSVIVSGKTGWMKFYTVNDYGFLGSLISINQYASNILWGFQGGHNLRTLKFSNSNTLTIPIIPPSC